MANNFSEWVRELDGSRSMWPRRLPAILLVWCAAATGACGWLQATSRAGESPREHADSSPLASRKPVTGAVVARSNAWDPVGRLVPPPSDWRRTNRGWEPIEQMQMPAETRQLPAIAHVHPLVIASLQLLAAFGALAACAQPTGRVSNGTGRVTNQATKQQGQHAG